MNECLFFFFFGFVIFFPLMEREKIECSRRIFTFFILTVIVKSTCTGAFTKSQPSLFGFPKPSFLPPFLISSPLSIPLLHRLISLPSSLSLFLYITPYQMAISNLQMPRFAESAPMR